MISEREFEGQTAPLRPALLAHCYRILGSAADAEDALQEAMVRAWRALPQFEGRSSLRRWLYTISTRTSLDMLKDRKRRSLASFGQPPGDITRPLPPPQLEPVWLEPAPDEWLADSAPSPDARLSARESVRLAFIAALQRLPARQRAVLILRDVVGYSAEETAEILELTVAAANSALQRARDGLDGEGRSDASGEDEAVVGRFVRALESSDAEGIAALLKADVVYSMPPFPLWLRGLDQVLALYTRVVFPQGPSRVVRTRANGGPALAVYQDTHGAGVFEPSALVLVDVDAGRVAALHAFLALDPKLAFARFGVPARLTRA